MELTIKLCLFAVLICAVLSTGGDNQDENDDTFVPTHEWQVVQKGKKIPKGLHVRVNLQTGITEAKLLDEAEEKERKTALTVAAVPEGAGNSNGLTDREVKKALRNIGDDYDVKSEEMLKRIDKLKSYEDLKKDLDDLNLTPKADAEILKELIEKHGELTSSAKLYNEDVDAVLLIIEDLEYLIHQYDNAKKFVALSGFATVIYKNLNSTNKEIKRETLKLLGSSLQNNANVKIHALETGTLDVLLRLLALEDDLTLKHRSLFALSGLLRGFPFAQLKFVRNAGLSVFSQLFDSKDIKIRLKMVILINDLFQEEMYLRRDLENQSYVLTIRQYEDINLKTLLLEQGYCKNLCDLLIDSVTVDPDDHDVVEKCLVALATVVDECAAKATQQVNAVLVNLRKIYENLVKERGGVSDNAEYFGTLFNLTDQIVKKFTRNVKAEL